MLDYTAANQHVIDELNDELLAALPDLTTDDLMAIPEEADENLDLDMTFWVNKENQLSQKFEPADLETLAYPYALKGASANRMRKDAKAAFMAMVDFAKKNADVKLMLLSGFRSYKTQEATFASWVKSHGLTMAERESAWAGHSEHQLGTVLDVTTPTLGGDPWTKFGASKEGKWLNDNAHYFGFVISYHETTEGITGYMFEPWHIRYVGRPLAQKMFKEGKVTEEMMLEWHTPPQILAGEATKADCESSAIKGKQFWTCKDAAEIRKCSADSKDLLVYACQSGCYSCASGTHDFCADATFAPVIAKERKCTLKEVKGEDKNAKSLNVKNG